MSDLSPATFLLKLKLVNRFHPFVYKQTRHEFSSELNRSLFFILSLRKQYALS